MCGAWKVSPEKFYAINYMFVAANAVEGKFASPLQPYKYKNHTFHGEHFDGFLAQNKNTLAVIGFILIAVLMTVHFAFCILYHFRCSIFVFLFGSIEMLQETMRLQR